MSRRLWLLIGIISFLGAIVALFNPLSATFTAEQLAGWLFLFVGVLLAVKLFSNGISLVIYSRVQPT
ncbi:hypothetical protein [Psychrobacter sp. CAL346-MNA-CIBAN-0220]|uniref:hypothetical protein n=1 Tax=Psychrobacter sp. CAL346-MNA-CIBAN-0220 TaxID=3140457 RepID=UPI00332510FC